jgi:hypothetical protein
MAKTKTRRMKGGQWYNPFSRKVMASPQQSNATFRVVNPMRQPTPTVPASFMSADEIKAARASATGKNTFVSRYNPFGPRTHAEPSSVENPRAPKSVVQRYSPFAPATPSEYKTSIGLFNSVSEGRNWERPTYTPNAPEGQKYSFKNEQHPNDKYWSKNHKGISNTRSKRGLPDAYYNYQFDEYNTKSPAWSSFKNDKGWVKPEDIIRLKKTSQGRFYATEPRRVRNTFKAFQNSFIKRQVNDYTRRFKNHTVKAQKKWTDTIAAKTRSVKQKLDEYDKEYKAYVNTLLADVKKAYDASVESQFALSRLELEKEAVQLEKETGWRPGTQAKPENETKGKNVRLTNALKTAAGVSVPRETSLLNSSVKPPTPNSDAAHLTNIFNPALKQDAKINTTHPNMLTIVGQSEPVPDQARNNKNLTRNAVNRPVTSVQNTSVVQNAAAAAAKRANEAGRSLINSAFQVPALPA